MIALVDYGMGNLRSVEKALTQVGGEVCIATQAAEISKADALVLPGVGAFGDMLQNLEKAGLVQAVKDFAGSGKPFFGICLGLQAMLDSSEESPGVKGLSLFPGTVPRFHMKDLKIPHMGWNKLKIQRKDCPVLQGVPDESFVYFVHSYYCVPREKAVVCGTTEYGGEFCSMLWSGNVYATQFHPEKSQAVGLKLLANFVKLI